MASPSHHKQDTQVCHPHSVYRKSATNKIVCFCNDSIGFGMDDPLATPPKLATIKSLFMDQRWWNVVQTCISHCETSSCLIPRWKWSFPVSTNNWTQCTKLANIQCNTFSGIAASSKQKFFLCHQWQKACSCRPSLSVSLRYNKSWDVIRWKCSKIIRSSKEL